MKSPSMRMVITTAGLLVVLVVIVLLAGLISRKANSSFFGPVPKGVTLQCLGNATNFLKFDHIHSWKAFSVSNGTSKTFFHTVTVIECRTPAGWVTNSPASAGLMTRHENAAEVAPGTSDVFYATVTNPGTAWRLHLGCFERSWSDSFDKSVSSFWLKIRGLPPSTQQSWSGRRYELTGDEIDP